jgi:hypothetical protein
VGPFHCWRLRRKALIEQRTSHETNYYRRRRAGGGTLLAAGCCHGPWRQRSYISCCSPRRMQWPPSRTLLFTHHRPSPIANRHYSQSAFHSRRLEQLNFNTAHQTITQYASARHTAGPSAERGERRESIPRNRRERHTDIRE